MRYDEHANMSTNEGSGKAAESIESEIRNLCENQSFAVLATQGQGQPYTSLIGFALTEDLKYIVFSTPRETRKFTLMEENNHVSFFIDDRASQPDSIDKISALTVTARVEIQTTKEDIEKWSNILIKKHPYLETFAQSDTTAIVVAKVFRYFYVRRFQEVLEWAPK